MEKKRNKNNFRNIITEMEQIIKNFLHFSD